MTNVLITGGAGYIGSKLATRLVNLNFNVTVIDVLKFTNDSLNHLFYRNNFNFIKEDIRNKKLMRDLIKKNEFIIPLAALVGAPLCEKNKKEAISINLDAIQFLVKNVGKKCGVFLDFPNFQKNQNFQISGENEEKKLFFF